MSVVPDKRQIRCGTVNTCPYGDGPYERKETTGLILG